MFIPLTFYCLLILLYWFATGCTEGWVWADENRRAVNCLIKGGSVGSAKIDYHGWRFFEILGSHGAILVVSLTLAFGAKAYGWEFIYNSGIKFIISGVGSMFLGMFVYERVLMYVCADKLFKESGWSFYIFGKTIKRYAWQDLIIAAVGIILIIEGYVV